MSFILCGIDECDPVWWPFCTALAGQLLGLEGKSAELIRELFIVDSRQCVLLNDQRTVYSRG